MSKKQIKNPLKEIERLEQEIKQLKSRKKYGLVWENKPEEVVEMCKEKLPVLREEKAKEIKSDIKSPVNILIEGDMILFKDGKEYKKTSVKPVLNLSGERVEGFPTQKPIGLIKYFLEILSRPNATIVDFFAGSGSTGHAVLDLNKENKDKRKFILCTNNENEICTKKCYPRLKGNIQGVKKAKGKNKVGLGGNLKYFTTDFVDGQSTDKNKKALVDKSTEMLCIKENCFNSVKIGKDFAIFEDGNNKYLGIIYDDGGIKAFNKEVKKIKKKFIVYVFSLDDSAREEEFEDVDKWVEPKPIPAVILNVYKRVFR